MTGNAVGLVEFLQARFDERELLAQRALHSDAVEPGQWVIEPYNSEDDVLPPERCHIAEDRHGHYWTVASDVYIPNADHMAANDPAYVLADIAAKRRIIELHAPRNRVICSAGCNSWSPCQTLLVLAAPFSSHPDWQPEWNTE
jgi:hypothetical protein